MSETLKQLPGQPKMTREGAVNTRRTGQPAAMSGCGTNMDLGMSAVNQDRKWGDMLMEEDNHFKYMEEEEWLQYVEQELNHPVIDVSVLEAVLEHEQERKKYKDFVSWITRGNGPIPIPRAKQDMNYRLWKDMVTESAKYGEDMETLPELEGKVMKTYWSPEVQKYKEKQELLAKVRTLVEKFKVEYDYKKKCAIVIQAVVRGHQCRNSTVCRFRDCCHCLAHTVCSLQVGWRYWVCKDCVREIVAQAE